MKAVAATGAVSERIDALLEARLGANERFFAGEADRLATLCHLMAERFARGGRLLASGANAVDVSDARHVAVEFVHPVIVGKRALPALSLPPGELSLIAREDDIAIAFGDGPLIESAVRDAGAAGCLTLAFTRVGAEWELLPPTDDPFIAQELAETAYHVLWELVHVFFDHSGLLKGHGSVPARQVHDSGASSFLYPFLGGTEDNLEAVLADVRASTIAKAQEVSDLRRQTLGEECAALERAATALRHCLDAGGTVLALGNGGSATDAMDAVADLREPPAERRWPARRALDLTADSPILTAIANDIGTEALFSRQVIAYGAAGDALLAISTSGNSPNVIHALAEARNRGLVTIALVGYDGGRVDAEQLADHIIVTRSEHIPRIQEAQASAWHVLRELLEESA